MGGMAAESIERHVHLAGWDAAISAVLFRGIPAWRHRCRAPGAPATSERRTRIRRFRTRLSGQRARLLFINSVSLLPGTLAADLQEDHLKIHALDRSVDFTEDLRRLEVAVGRIYQEVL